jgi:thiol-disulfide isomerase/thioredoxin
MKRLALLPLLLLFALAACKRESDAPARPVAPVPAAAPADAPAAATTTKDVAAPALKVTTVDGKPWDLAGHRGRWVVVNFWATWCGPCLKEMPDLSALDAMREHVEVIGLAYEEIEPAELRAFLQQHPVVYPVAIVDVYDPPADFATPRGLPTTYLIAPDGRIAKHFLGPVTAAEIDAAIAAAGGPAV